MQELTAGTRVDIAALCQGRSGQVLSFWVRGRDVVDRVPPGLHVWALREGEGTLPAMVLTWGPGGPGAGETWGEARVAGVTLDLGQLLGQGDAGDPRTDSRIVLAAVWPDEPWTPLTFEVRCGGRVVARTAFPEVTESSSRGGAVVLGRLYRRTSGVRLWVQMESAGHSRGLEGLLRLPAGTLQGQPPAQEGRPPVTPDKHTTSPRPPSAAASGSDASREPEPPTGRREQTVQGSTSPLLPGQVRPSLASSLARLAAAWSALMGGNEVAPPASSGAPAAADPSGGPVPPEKREPDMAPRTAQALTTLQARLTALGQAFDEEATESREEGFLLTPEHARRRARLTGLLETHARIQLEATALARRVRRLDTLGGPSGVIRPPEIAEVENAIEGAVQALSAAIDQEARALAGEPLAQSRARLQSEARFLEDLTTEDRLPWDR